MAEHIVLGDRVEEALAGLHDVERTAQEQVYVTRRQSGPRSRGRRSVVVQSSEYRAAFDNAVETFAEVARDEDFGWEQVVAGIIRFRPYDPGIQPLRIPSAPIKTIEPISVKQRMQRVEALRASDTPFIYHGFGKMLGVGLGGFDIDEPKADPAQNGLPNANLSFPIRFLTMFGTADNTMPTSVLEIFSNFTVGADAIEEHWKQQRNLHNPHSAAPEHTHTLGRLDAEARIFKFLGVELDTTPISDIARKYGYDTIESMNAELRTELLDA
jgi:hypothetical protein